MHLPTFLPTLLLLLFISPTTPLSILLPFYIDPNTSPTSWTALNTAITNHPSVQWRIIINPNSGPGTSASQPSDPAYVDAISSLNTHANVITLGYVPTGYAGRASADVMADTDVYASWRTADTADTNTTIAGIFLDEVISADETQATEANLAYYTDLSTHIATALSSDAFTVLNPGTLGPEPLFAACDLMVESEVPVSEYGAGTLAGLSEEYLAQAAVILYGAEGSTDVGALVEEVAGSGVGAVFVDYGGCEWEGRPTGCYTKFTEEGLEALAGAVEAVG